MPTPETQTGAVTEDVLLREADSLASKEQWEEAISLMRGYCQQNSLSPAAQGKLAYYCSRAGHYDQAIQIYTVLSEQFPSEAKWIYGLGVQYSQKEEWAAAVPALEKCLQLAPRWLLAMLRLGDAYAASDCPERALKVYREGVQSYRGLKSSRQAPLALIYVKLCGKAGRAILAQQTASELERKEAIELLRESVTGDPSDANNWYRLGCAQLDAGLFAEALDSLQKAESLAPKKEYINHKIAQTYMKRGELDQAIAAYEKVPRWRRPPYILHGMAQCHMLKGEFREAAFKLHQAIKHEPRKFYHHWDFGLALIALRARDQALEALEKANSLFKEEYGKDYAKAITKLEEVRKTLPPGERISFEEPTATVSAISFGAVTKYDSGRGFGFIKDDADGARVFFHFTRIKGRSAPALGARVKFARESGEKGFQATKVWLLDR